MLKTVTFGQEGADREVVTTLPHPQEMPDVTEQRHLPQKQGGKVTSSLPECNMQGMPLRPPWVLSQQLGERRNALKLISSGDESWCWLFFEPDG